jgi:hypothetical protein
LVIARESRRYCGLENVDAVHPAAPHEIQAVAVDQTHTQTFVIELVQR